MKNWAYLLTHLLTHFVNSCLCSQLFQCLLLFCSKCLIIQETIEIEDGNDTNYRLRLRRKVTRWNKIKEQPKGFKISKKVPLVELNFFIKIFFINHRAEAYSDPCQTPKIEPFAKIVNGFKKNGYFCKNFDLGCLVNTPLILFSYRNSSSII